MYRAVALAAVLSVSAAGGARAQYLDEIDLLGQPLQYLKDGKVNGCGVRITSLRILGSPPKTAQGVDASFNVFAPGIALIKGAFMEGPFSELGTAGRPPSRPITRLWLRAAGHDATEPSDGQFRESPTDTPALLYFTGSTDPVMALFTAALTKRSIQIGVRAPSWNADRVFFGVVKLSDAETEQVADCINDLLRNLKQ